MVHFRGFIGEKTVADSACQYIRQKEDEDNLGGMGGDLRRLMRGNNINHWFFKHCIAALASGFIGGAIAYFVFSPPS